MSADLTHATEIEAMFASSAPYGAVDILVNNAGDLPSAAIEEMTSAEWAEVFSVNVDETFACLQAAARSMSQLSEGAIVNIASLSALRPTVRDHEAPSGSIVSCPVCYVADALTSTGAKRTRRALIL